MVGQQLTFSESGNNPGGKRQTNVQKQDLVLYTIQGTGANASCQLAHGLGKAPEMIIFKRIYTCSSLGCISSSYRSRLKISFK